MSEESLALSQTPLVRNVRRQVGHSGDFGDDTCFGDFRISLTWHRLNIKHVNLSLLHRTFGLQDTTIPSNVGEVDTLARQDDPRRQLWTIRSNWQCKRRPRTKHLHEMQKTGRNLGPFPADVAGLPKLAHSVILGSRRSWVPYPPFFSYDAYVVRGQLILFRLV